MARFRFVAWDRRTAFEPKAAALAGLRPDVAVLAEVPGDKPTIDGLTAWESTLRERAKGLAIASFGPSLRGVHIDPRGGRFSISTAVEGNLGPLGVLGVWPVPRTSSYRREVEATLAAYGSWLKETPSIDYRRESEPWHLDYCFVHESLLVKVVNLTIGTFAGWTEPKISDHVPLIVEFDL